MTTSKFTPNLPALLTALLILGLLAPITFAATNVSIWGWRGDAALWDAVEQALNERGVDVNIDYQRITATEYDSKLALSLQSGRGPDIAYTRRLPGQRTQDLIDGGFLVALDDEISFSNFTDTTLNYIRSGDRIWGVPFANQIIGIFYNQDMYEQHGLEEPATWDQLVENAQVLQDSGVTPFFLPGREAWILAMQHAMTGVSSPGPDWIKSLQEGEVDFLDPEFIDIAARLNALKPFYQKDFMANVATDQDSAFAFEQTAMVFYGIWATRQWQELNPELSIGYFPVPPVDASADAHAYVYMDGSFALNSNASQPEAGLEVLSFTATPEFGTIFAEVNGEMPAVLGATIPEDRPLLQEGVQTAETSAAPYTYWVGSPLQMGTPSLYDVLTSGMQELYLGDITPEDLAKQAQNRVGAWYEPLQE